MNKKIIHKSTDSAKNISMLSGSAVGSRALVLDKGVAPFAQYPLLRPYFDICIMEEGFDVNYCKEPDIFISSRDTPHTNGIFDDGIYSKYASSIICVNYSELSLMKRLGAQHNAYVMAWAPTAVDPAGTPEVISGIAYGLSAIQPGKHLAMIMGATEVFCLSDLGVRANDELNRLVTEKTNHRPKNIRRPTRPQFLEEVNITI